MVGKDTERNFTACYIMLAPDVTVVSECFFEDVTSMDSRVWRAYTEMDGFVDDSEDDDRFDACQRYEIIGGLRERLPFGFQAIGDVLKLGLCFLQFVELIRACILGIGLLGSL